MPEISLDGAAFLTTLVTVLVIMDPVGNVPIFLALTRDQSPREQKRSALLAAVVAGAVIFLFALAGEQLLSLLGISLEALQIAGGLLLLIIGYELLNPEGGGFMAAAGPDANVALVPLGTPLLAGPGAIAATMLAIAEADGVGGRLSVSAALAVALVAVWLALRFASRLARILRPSFINLLSRVLGLLVAAIGVQLLAEAIEIWVEGGVS
ncbi:MAG TPA: MarC family protein [Acidimicrobiales bacterium]|nr:MarC family protein [Acidimicrobiales bacterium]